VGRNRPAAAMPFDGMVRRYLIIYSVNLLLLTNECQQRISTDYALGVAHNTSHILRLSPARSDSTSACVREGARTGSFFQRTLGFIRAIAGRKFHLQFLRAIPLFTFTHNSCVMSTICQSPRACRGDFQQLLPSRMD
jgi:hypothetical protein